MPLLEARNLRVGIHRSRRIFTAVNGIDFTINAGEIIALAGESGCGKTLTSLSIMRLLPPAAEISGGEINYHANNGETISINSINEKSLRHIRGKEIAMIFQEPKQSLNPLMRVGTQIAETLELHGTDRVTAKAAALDMLRKLNFPEPENILRAWPHQLSGGMCQRVMIAIAAICRPRLLIADEPITALDTANRHNILSLLKHINKEFGTAILFISHDLAVIRDLCNRCMVMYAGNIIESGPSQMLFTTPLHPYTAALMKAIPSPKNRGQPLAHIPGRPPSVEDNLSGCPFAPRCPHTRQQCADAFPPLIDIRGHKVRCLYAGAHND